MGRGRRGIGLAEAPAGADREAPGLGVADEGREARVRNGDERGGDGPGDGQREQRQHRFAGAEQPHQPEG